MVIAAAVMPCRGIAVVRDSEIVANARYGVAVGRGATRGEAYSEASSRVPVGATIYRRDVVAYEGSIKQCTIRLYWRFSR